MPMTSARTAIAVMLLGFVSLARAQQAPSVASAPSAPQVVRVDGQFVPANGLPPAAVETVTLAIYASAIDATPLFEETQDVRVNAQGRYAIFLGATRAEGVPMSLFAPGESRWLGMRFARPGEGEQARVPLTSVPYALHASDADTLGGLPPSAFLRASGTAGPTGTPGAASTTARAAGSNVSTGTANFIGKFTNAVDLTSSVLSEHNGRIGLSTTTPLDFLHSQFTDNTGSLTGLAVQNLGSTAASYSGMLFYDQNGALAQFQGFNNVSHEYRINNIASGGSINFMINSSSKFVVAPGGSIGIGTNNPTRGLLEIVGGSGTYSLGTFGLFTTAGATGNNPPTSFASASLYATSTIVGLNFIAHSDERIKRIQGRSDAARDLATLAGIEVTDYTYIDALAKGTGPQKKVIAQQVERVYPQAVSRSTDVVPDIYLKAQVKDGWVMLTTNLKQGERVRLIGTNNEGIRDVLEIAEGKFRTDFTAEGDEVFVYGREVKDFRAVDYEAIAMLNVSATQELHRRLEQQTSDLAAQAQELATLKQQLADLQSALVAARLVANDKK